MSVEMSMVFCGPILGIIWLSGGVFDLNESRNRFKELKAEEAFYSLTYTASFGFGLFVGLLCWWEICLPGYFDDANLNGAKIIQFISMMLSGLIGGTIIGEFIIRRIGYWLAPEVIFWRPSDLWQGNQLYPDLMSPKDLYNQN